VIKVYDGVGYESERFDTINDRLRRFAMKMQGRLVSGGPPATQLIAAIGLSVVIGLALWQARASGLSGGEFIMFPDLRLAAAAAAAAPFPR